MQNMLTEEGRCHGCCPVTVDWSLCELCLARRLIQSSCSDAHITTVWISPARIQFRDKEGLVEPKRCENSIGGVGLLILWLPMLLFNLSQDCESPTPQPPMPVVGGVYTHQAHDGATLGLIIFIVAERPESNNPREACTPYPIYADATMALLCPEWVHWQNGITCSVKKDQSKSLRS